MSTLDQFGAFIGKLLMTAMWGGAIFLLIHTLMQTQFVF